MKRIFGLEAWWWKILAMICLVYVFVGGLLTPLSPGVLAIQPEEIQCGEEVRFQITGYNTLFSKASSVQKVWLRYKNEKICARMVGVEDDNRLSFNIRVPDTLGNSAMEFKTLDLVMYDDKHGTVSFRNVLRVVASKDSVKERGMSCAGMIPIEEAKGTHFPYREILHESIRNLFFHVPMWFAMLGLLFVSFIYSLVYLFGGEIKFDKYAAVLVEVGVLFGCLGILTGMIWATYTWGSPWPKDPKLNGAAIGMLIYFAYMILRGSVTDEIRRAKVSGVYSIFAFLIYITFIFIMPRLEDSLHPGNGGNPAFSSYDLDNSLRKYFYPAVIGWTLIGFWLASIKIRYTFALRKVQGLD